MILAPDDFRKNLQQYKLKYIYRIEPPAPISSYHVRSTSYIHSNTLKEYRSTRRRGLSLLDNPKKTGKISEVAPSPSHQDGGAVWSEEFYKTGREIH